MKNFANPIGGIVGLTLLTAFSACSGRTVTRLPAQESEAQMANTLDEFVETLGCEEINDNVWGWGAKIAVDFDSDASGGDDALLRRRLGETLVARGRLGVSSQVFRRFAGGLPVLGAVGGDPREEKQGRVFEKVVGLYRFFSKGVPAALNFSDLNRSERTDAIHTLREGDLEEGGVYGTLQGEFAQLLTAVKLEADAAGIECHREDRQPTRLFDPNFAAKAKASWEKSLKKIGNSLFRRRNTVLGADAPAPSVTASDLNTGARRIFATLYQGCRVLDLPAMPKDYAIEGIGFLEGRNGRGRKRVVKNLEAMLKTHYYVKGFEPQEGCIDIRTAPPIYDFGGKPYMLKGRLDLFTDAGSGTEARGIDCSGFVTSSLMAAGLRLAKDKDFELFNDMDSTNAAALRQPGSERNCLTAYKIKMVDSEKKIVSTLQAGDIAASSGHVIIVEKVGADPFKISAIKKAEDCTAGNFDVDDFDIQIVHSSPEADGIGLARQKVGSFTSETYRSAFVELAVSTCRAKFNAEKSYSSITASGVNFVRHDLSEACRTEPVSIVQSKCIESCWK